MASGINKPNGLTVILPEHAQDFVEALPIEKFHGIGEVTATKMHSLGIHYGADLKRHSVAELMQHFGKIGYFYYKIARAEDERVVEPNRIRKSIGAETSFVENLSEPALIFQELEAIPKGQASFAGIAQTLQHRLESHQALGRTITLKVKFGDYQQITRSKTILASIREANLIFVVAKELFGAIDLENRSIRLLGISLSNLDRVAEPMGIQLSLFESS